MWIKLSFMHTLWAVSLSLALSMGSSDISHSYSHSNADALLNTSCMTIFSRGQKVCYVASLDNQPGPGA